MGCHALLQGIFPTQGSNPGLLRGGQVLYHLSYREVPIPRSLFSARTFQNGSTGQCHDQGQHHGHGQKLDPSSAPSLPRELLRRVWGRNRTAAQGDGKVRRDGSARNRGENAWIHVALVLFLYFLLISLKSKSSLRSAFPFPWEGSRCPLPPGEQA